MLRGDVEPPISMSENPTITAQDAQEVNHYPHIIIIIINNNSSNNNNNNNNIIIIISPSI